MFFGISFPATGEAQKPVAIKAIMAWSENYSSNGTFREWVAKVKETGKGPDQGYRKPEAIPLLEQIGARGIMYFGRMYRGRSSGSLLDVVAESHVEVEGEIPFPSFPDGNNFQERKGCHHGRSSF
jgi:hypothetical protein